MKYLCFFALLLFFSCERLNDVNERLEKIEDNNPEALEQAPKLLSFGFLREKNPKEIIEDVDGEILGDSIVECWIDNILDNKQLMPQLSYVGDSVYVDGRLYTPSIGKYCFNSPAKILVFKGKKSKSYIVYLHSYTGLPRVYIETEFRQPITSKEEYLDASFKIVEDVVTRSPGDVIESPVKIKGRGNATWYAYGDKKPYRLKFPEKISLLDEPKDKSYILLANAIDKTSLRNSTAFYMSQLSTLDYTPSFHFVDLFLNGVYYGTYQLGDKLKISKNRVNVGDDGFLLEIDSRAYREKDAVYFEANNLKTPILNNTLSDFDDQNLEYKKTPINIKEPEVAYGDENYEYIKKFVIEADSVLFSDNYTDPNKGWQKYFDLNSFCDWYLINELSRNGDAIFITSCWMSLKRGGKLKMGPVWDFDTAFGNNNTVLSTPWNGYYIGKYASWFKRLLLDPFFYNHVKARFQFFYDNKDRIFNHIDENANYIQRSIEQNEYRWNNLYIENFNNQKIWGGVL